MYSVYHIDEYVCYQGKPGEPVKMKDEKELKPASMRVRDSAEALLTVVLEQVCHVFFSLNFQPYISYR